MLDTVLISEDSAEPVSIELLRAWLKIDEVDPARDMVLNLINKAARAQLENETGLSFKPKVFQGKINGYIKLSDLPHGPNQEILTALDPEGNAVLIDQITGNNYEYQRGFTVQNTYVDEYGYDGVPIGLRDYNGFVNYPSRPRYTITYSAGYEIGKLPPNLEMAILRFTAIMYDNPATQTPGAPAGFIPAEIRQLIGKDIALPIL